MLYEVITQHRLPDRRGPAPAPRPGRPQRPPGGDRHLAPGRRRRARAQAAGISPETTVAEVALTLPPLPPLPPPSTKIPSGTPQGVFEALVPPVIWAMP